MPTLRLTAPIRAYRPVNHLGRPLRERWMFIAFCVSDQTEGERNKAIAAEYRYARVRHILDLQNPSRYRAVAWSRLRSMLVVLEYSRLDRGGVTCVSWGTVCTRMMCVDTPNPAFERVFCPGHSLSIKGTESVLNYFIADSKLPSRAWSLRAQQKYAAKFTAIKRFGYNHQKEHEVRGRPKGVRAKTIERER